MKTTLLRNSILFLASLLCVNVRGQVTIGSGNPPIQGALLDLKEDIITTKGLGLPRVNLSKLNPTSPSELAKSIGGIGSWVLTEHTGLVIYNINEDLCAYNPIYNGVYVFNGKEWEYISNEDNRSPAVRYYPDNRAQLLGNQIYPYRRFGSAGDWMLENMRYVPDDGGASMTESLGNFNFRGKYYIYPNTTTLGTVPATWSPHQGFLYTFSAATMGEQDDTIGNQGQEQMNEGPATPIQGICPPNWHIPSDREWNELEKEIYEHAGEYSNYTPAELSNSSIWTPISASNAWVPSWNTYIGSRGSTGTGGHGLAMQSFCQMPGATQDASNGKSFSRAQGGFNILYPGSCLNGTVGRYGEIAVFWASSVHGYYGAWTRSIEWQNQKMARNDPDRYFFFSVRCKRTI